MYGARLRIPSPEHLVALELHALKHTRAHRSLKDFQDVEGIVRVARLDLQSEGIRHLFLKYGTLDLLKKSAAPAPKTEPGFSASPKAPPDLELPVAPEFVSRPPRLDPQVMLERCAQAMPWRNARPGERERRRAEKIYVEFVL